MMINQEIENFYAEIKALCKANKININFVFDHKKTDDKKINQIREIILPEDNYKELETRLDDLKKYFSSDKFKIQTPINPQPSQKKETL